MLVSGCATTSSSSRKSTSSNQSAVSFLDEVWDLLVKIIPSLSGK